LSNETSAGHVAPGIVPVLPTSGTSEQLNVPVVAAMNAAATTPSTTASMAATVAATSTMNNGKKDTSNSDVQKLQEQLNDIKEQVCSNFQTVSGLLAKNICFFLIFRQCFLFIGEKYLFFSNFQAMFLVYWRKIFVFF
jgi:hypothetical protein